MEDFGFHAHKMHLYLKNGEKQQRWLIVQLVEGHTPRVAGLSSDDTRYVTDNLEPAIWFKVMVLESISIDCSKRVVHWTNGIKDKDGLPITYSMYGGDKSCYDFDDDIDELFNLANYLIEMNPLAEPKEDMRRERIIEYEHSLFRMLHCYILSKIILQPRDIECVYNALKAQNKSIAQLEDVTLMHSRLAEHYLSQMRNMREVEILPLVEQLVEENHVGKELLQVLSYDLKKAEPMIRREVDKAQKLVDHLKEMASIGAHSAKLSHELADARRNRDSTHQNLVSYLVSKELVRKALTAANRDKANKIELNEVCQQYMRLHKRVQEEKKISSLTVDKKIRAASVRECIEAVIKELKQGRQTDGDEMTTGGQRPTDIMDGEKSNPEWQTLSQRLSSIVHNNDHPIGLSFTRFCQMLEVNYRKILQSVEHIAYGSSKFMTSFDDFYVVSEVDMGLNKAYLEDQRNIILGHLYQATELLSETFSNSYTMFIRKVRLCYEKCFFNRIGRDLILVYRIVHGKSMQTLEKRISSLKDVQICKLGLQMKDEWWLTLFEPDVKEISEVEVAEEESEDESYIGSVEEYGDDEDLTDIEEDEYCTDSDHEHGMNLYFSNKNEVNVKKMKAGLQSSKNKVLSRSMTGLDDIQTNTKLLKDEITDRAEKARPRFDSAAMTRFLQDDHVNVRQESLRKCYSTSSLNVANKRPNVKPFSPPVVQHRYHYEEDSFDVHFGPALSSIKNIFSNSSPLKKMQCLTTALRFIATKVEELRMRGKDEETVDRAKISVTAEDLLPLLVLVLLKMLPHDLAKLYVEILFVSDLMADFLSSGCHSYALCEFQIAFRVLDQTCDELSI